MNKSVLFFLFIFCVTVSYAQKITMKDIRNDFNKGVKDEALCESYFEWLDKNAKTDTEKGYKAAFQMFMAKHTGNPIKKMSYFKGGKKLLEEQIKFNPNNVELRFIRLCIQYHSPSFLGYRDDIQVDKNFMIDNLYKINDVEIKQLLFKYLRGADIYNEKELAMLSR